MNFIVKKHLFVLQIMLIHKLIRRCMESKDPNKENNLFVAWNLHFNTLGAAIFTHLNRRMELTILIFLRVFN